MNHVGWYMGRSRLSCSLVALGGALVLSVLQVNSAGAQLEQLRKARPSGAAVETTAVAMVTVPAGAFRMGRDGAEALEDERPNHEVWLDAFAIDRYEVTTQAYATFLAQSQRSAPAFWDTVALVKYGDRPVVGVSWHDADAFCQWADKRLPTEAEWEKAARGTDERRYPWGNQDPTPDRANFALGARFSYEQVLLPVGRFPAGASPYGVQDLAGNVGEWVQDWYAGNYYETTPPNNPQGPEQGQFKVLRGGSWSDLPKYLLTYSRFRLQPETQNSFTGFRCAKSLP